MHALSNMDLAAAAWFLFAWLGFNLLIDVSPLRKKTLSSAMETYRRGWMRAMSLREVRIMDTSIMSGLQQAPPSSRQRPYWRSAAVSRFWMQRNASFRSPVTCPSRWPTAEHFGKSRYSP